MSRIVYVNGKYLPESEASLSVFDRGFLFADGVYEVTSVMNGRLVDNPVHLARLHRSLGELEIPPPASDAEIEAIQYELLKRNRLQDGLVYLQVTRGSADRDFLYPAEPRPSLVMFTQARNLLASKSMQDGIRIALVDDLRWKRRDIKTIALLPASMAKMQARRVGADDAWLVENGNITEGSSNNAWIVDARGVLITRNLGHEILAGVTRKAVLQLAAADAVRIEERAFNADEARAAREAFITSATTFVTPVIAIDGQAVGSGSPGPITRRLQQLYIEMAKAQTHH